MGTPSGLLLILQIGTGLFWSLTYIFILRKGFLDRAYGMPLAALCANISWEFIFSFVFPHGFPQRFIDIVWFSLDAMILCQYIMFGRKEFEKYLPAKYFLQAFLLALVTAFMVVIAAICEFNDVMGKYTAFSSNIMMSILFIILLIQRGTTAGQSVYIAFFKMVGSLLPGIAFYIYFRSPFITVLAVGDLLFDLIYLVLLCRKFRNDGINPWANKVGRCLVR